MDKGSSNKGSRGAARTKGSKGVTAEKKKATDPLEIKNPNIEQYKNYAKSLLETTVKKQFEESTVDKGIASDLRVPDPNHSQECQVRTKTARHRRLQDQNQKGIHS
jgi:hypothetical protein